MRIHKRNEKGILFRPAFFSLAAALLVVNCSATQGQNTRSETNSVTGRLSIDAKALALNSVYACRMKRSTPRADREILTLTLTTKALSAADLQTLLERYSATQIDQELLSDKTVTGLFFTIEKHNLRPVMYFEHIIRAGHVYRRGGRQFLEFNLSKGRITGKAVDPFTAGDADGSENANGNRFKYRYTTGFDTTLRGEPLHKVLEGAAAPGVLAASLKQGAAEGTLTVNGNTINLKYAYAARERVFFDEPEESIPVLITDRPLSEEDLLLTLRKEAPIRKGVHGLLISFTSNQSQLYGLILFHNQLESGSLAGTATQTEGVTITKDNISAKATGEDKRGNDNWTYSVKFSAPFKNESGQLPRR